MKNGYSRRKRAKKKFRRLAAAFAGAAIMSSALLPAIHPATVSAAADPAAGKDQAAASQQKSEEQAEKPAGKVPSHYEKVINVVATAYAPGPQDNDQWGNKTHFGTQIRPGVIAVDPDVIPLGSRVYIQYPDGRGMYAVAEDTGGAIKGNRIDVAKWTVNEAKDFGIQHAKVFVLSTPKTEKA